MNTPDKLPYEPLVATPIELPQSLYILVDFSISAEGEIEDPEYDDLWGTKRGRKNEGGRL
jgi:hypothetical protein|nr:hypothetical protein [uncultured Porphyromonas sp.]